MKDFDLTSGFNLARFVENEISLVIGVLHKWRSEEVVSAHPEAMQDIAALNIWTERWYVGADKSAYDQTLGSFLRY